MWRLLCSCLGHERSSSIWRNPNTDRWEGECKHCGEPMVRLEHGVWRARGEVDQLSENLL